jgi:hypothetical protein
MARSEPMRELPADVLRTLTAENRKVTEAWWLGLDAAAQLEFSQLWDTRSDDTAYCATIEDGRTVWHELPITLVALHAGTESPKENAFWQRQLGEYINGHEVKFFLAQRTFHVCRAHAIAREVGRTGVIPADFACPLQEAACPFERALDCARVEGARQTLWLVPVRRRA